MKSGNLFVLVAFVGFFSSSMAQTNTWYDNAQDRIDSLRKGNFSFVVVDKDGFPVQDSVRINHIRHEFPFGVSYDFSSNGVSGNTYSTSQSISCEKDTVVYMTERFGKELYYKLPVDSGNAYKLTLKFAEIYFTSAGNRIFDVYINNVKKLDNFDIYAAGGAAFTALDTTFEMVSDDSVINITLIALKDNAKINGIALYDSGDNPVILANCGGPETSTTDGVFVADTAYIDRNARTYNPTADDWAEAVMYKYFNSSVTGNPFKWSGIEADSGVLKYDLVDAAANWGNKVDFNYRGHCLIWGATSATDYHELPKWVHDLLPTPQLAWSACQTHVLRDAGKYRNFFKDYDVLNEPLHATVLQNGVGDSINWYAFKWAHDTAPNVNLYVNEYNAEWDNTTARNYKTLVQNMIAHGAHIDGIGFQAHMYLHPNPNYGGFIQNGDSHYDIDIAKLKLNVDTLAKLGLQIKFTEFDLDTMDAVKQAFNYARMMRFAFSYPLCTGLTFWSLTEPAWQPNIGGMFDSKKRPKVVMDSIYHLLHEVWTTRLTDLAQADGSYGFSGYYGNYEISVKTADGWKVFSVPYIKSNEDSVFILKEDEGMPERPNFISASILDRNHAEVKFDRKMADPLPDIHNFMFFNDLSTRIDSAYLKDSDSTTIVFVTQSPVKSGYYVSLGYVKGTQTSASGGILENFGPEFVYNPYPGLIKAYSSTDGKTVTLKFNQPMNDPAGNESNFTIQAGSNTYTIVSFTTGTGSDSIFILSLNDSIRYDENPTITYTPGNITAVNGFELDAFTRIAVINKVPEPVSLTDRNLPEFNIFPNPANDLLYYTCTDRVATISICTILGQTIRSVQPNAVEGTLDISGLQQGAYLVSVISESGSKQVAIVLVSR
jgi:GH35 family endo-1,4-beta-xylanase